MTVIAGITLRPEDHKFGLIAAQIAAKFGEPLRLVHVCEDTRAPIFLGTDQEYLLGPIREQLTQLAVELAASTGATVQPHLAAGSAVNALTSLAELDLATLLVVGPTTRSLRNTAERVSRASQVPVLVPRDLDRLTQWLDGQTTLRVLVGADFGRTASAARRFSATLQRLGAIDVEVAYVASPEQTHARLGMSAPEHGLSTEAETAVLRELEARSPPGEPPVTFHVITGHSRADAHLVARADAEDFDVVVVGQRKRTFVSELWNGSIARGVLQSAPMSVVSVPLMPGEVDRNAVKPDVILVGTDLSEKDHRALAHAVAYASEGATIHIVHVIDTSALPATLASNAGDYELRGARDAAHAELQALRRDAALAPGLKVQLHVLEGQPSTVLEAMSRRTGARLIVLGARERSRLSRVLLGSVAQSLVESSEVPVLLVPCREL